MFKNDDVSDDGVFNAYDAVMAVSANDILSIPNGPSTFSESMYDAVSDVPPPPPPPKMVTNIPSEPDSVTSTPEPVKLIFAVCVCTNELV